MEPAVPPLRCLVCGGERFVRQFPRIPPPQGDVVAPAVYKITHSQRALVGAILRCTDCGLALMPPPRRTQDSYEDAADPHYIEQAEQRIANAHALLELVPRGGRLLDVGCACGFLLVAARERGYEAQGVEVSRWAVEFGQRTLGLDIRRGELCELRLPAASFDVVTMVDVIEHLIDPRAVVAEVRRLLRPGGRIVLVTPDLGSLVARLTGPRWYGLLDDHYFYFSRDTLRRFLESEGFAVEQVRAFGRRFPLDHWSYKLSQYSLPLSRALGKLFRALRIDKLQVSVNLGDQMACVARKQ